MRLRDDLETDVRERLAIPFNAGTPAIAYEHSMGMTALPAHILRTSGAAA